MSNPLCLRPICSHPECESSLMYSNANTKNTKVRHPKGTLRVLERLRCAMLWEPILTHVMRLARCLFPIRHGVDSAPEPFAASVLRHDQHSADAVSRLNPKAIDTKTASQRASVGGDNLSCIIFGLLPSLLQSFGDARFVSFADRFAFGTSSLAKTATIAFTCCKASAAARNAGLSCRRTKFSRKQVTGDARTA